MRSKALYGGLLTLALGAPVFAAPASPVTAERVAQRIESARVRIESALAERPVREAPVGQRGGRTMREIGFERAQEELAAARESFERGDLREADRLAYQAARLAWKASDPRKGEK